MQRIDEVIGPFSARSACAEEWRREQRERLLQQGHDKWGWSLDAECVNCGDTGKWPNSFHYCGCAAGEARKLRDREASEREQFARRWERTGVPRRFHGYRLETAPDQVAAAAVRDWMGDRPVDGGENLLLTGPVGTGKTGLAVGALWVFHEVGQQGLQFVSVPYLLDGLRPEAEDPASLLACQRAIVLVLDDLGAEKPSDWVRERLYVLVNARYEQQLPTIATTNLDLTRLATNLGERTVSRFAESMTVVAMDGPDRRRG